MVARWLISWCLRNPFLVLLFARAGLGWGGWAARHTPVDAIPDIGEKQVIVFADWSGRYAHHGTELRAIERIAAQEFLRKLREVERAGQPGSRLVCGHRACSDPGASLTACAQARNSMLGGWPSPFRGSIGYLPKAQGSPTRLVACHVR